MARLWRVHHAELPDRAGQTVELGRTEAHHVQRVLRLRAGESVAVFDGRGHEWRAVLERSDREGVRARLAERIEDPVEPPCEVALWQGLCKPERMDWIVQKATEVGASSIEVLATSRTERPRGIERRVERWRRVALEAAKQSGRRVVPAVGWREELAAVPDGTLGLVLDPRPEAPPLARVVAAVPAGPVWIGVGPEGGLDPEEAAAWVRLGWRPARLGPRTLRADTAGVVAATLVLHRRGDLGA